MQLLRAREEVQLTGSMHGAAVAAFARPRSAPLGDCSSKKRKGGRPPPFPPPLVEATLPFPSAGGEGFN